MAQGHGSVERGSIRVADHQPIPRFAVWEVEDLVRAIVPTACGRDVSGASPTSFLPTGGEGPVGWK